jgi:formate hydrogenlyase subunit 6/NADH:ubiquinone oxidoreductase subunit I
LELCLLYYNKECSICRQVCPYEAVEYVWNEEEYIRAPRIDAARCPGCGACAIACPGTNDWEREHSETPIPVRKAIWIDPDRSAAPRVDPDQQPASEQPAPSPEPDGPWLPPAAADRL